jgi:hypothetical protein
VIRMHVRHQVSDYNAWREVYDEFGPVQKENGVVAEAVYQSIDDPNDVTVLHDFNTADEARAFATNPLLKDAMQRAGMAGAPTIWFTTES